MNWRFLFVAILSLSIGATAYEPSASNLEARKWFQDSKFGLFIHWGPYSVLENGEWVLEKSKLSLVEYSVLALSRFNPVKFDPAAWVSMAKDAGMKYITITSRHHDGFAMWGTAQNKWNIVDSSPYGADILKQLAEECHRQDMKLFFYYSQVDWHHPEYFPWGTTGHHSGRISSGDFEKYLDYMDAQLTELLTGYGEIAGIWFDGMWDKPDANWRLTQTYDLIHRLQPAALVGSNHHLDPFEGEDFQMFERDLPGQATQVFSHASTKVSQLPLETCQTINGAWGYKKQDQNFKSKKELIHSLVKAAGNNANFLLNVGPRSDGTIQPEFVERLQEVGAWLKENGETIYETRGGPVLPASWGVSTQKGDTVYLHILSPEENQITIPHLKGVSKAKLWPQGREVPLIQEEDQYVLQLLEDDFDAIDTIVELGL